MQHSSKWPYILSDQKWNVKKEILTFLYLIGTIANFLEFRSRGEQRRMWTEMIIFADKHTDNQVTENSKAEATFYPLWSVDTPVAGQ